MILTAHQPVYAPWAGLFDKIAGAEQFCLVDVCPMEDSGYENRVRIMGATGEQWLTVPVHRHRGVEIRDVTIANQGWQRKHFRSLELAYKRAPFWDAYVEKIEPVYMLAKWTHLLDLNEALLATLLEILGLQRRLVRASTIGASGTKSELVLDICKRMGATEYVFGSNGRDYADLDLFQKHGIKVRFQDYQHPTYSQQHRGFTAGLSVLDLIFNVGPDALKVLRNGD